MWAAIKYNLANLTNPNGRDARQTFWYFVLIIAVCQVGVTMLISIPMTMSAMAESISAVSQGADPEQINATMMANMGATMGPQIWVGAIASLIGTLLLMCSFIRRLHDSGKSGYWALLVLIAQLAGIAYSISTIEDIQAYFSSISDLETLNPGTMLQQQKDMAAKGLVRWVGPIIVIIFGVMKSTDGPNAYGEKPVRF